MAWLEDLVEEFKKLKAPAKVAAIGGLAAAGFIGYSFLHSREAGSTTVTDPLGASLASGNSAFGNNATDQTSQNALYASLLAALGRISGQLTSIGNTDAAIRKNTGSTNNTLNNLYKKTTGGGDPHGPPARVHPIETIHH